VSDPAGKGEYGRYIETDKVAMGVWVRLVKLFVTWKLIFFAGTRKRTWMQASNDQLTILTRSKHWKVGLGLLGGLSDGQVDFLLEYARLNAERVERVFRTTALLLITIPVGAIVAINEVSPTLMEDLGFGDEPFFIGLMTGWGVVVGYLMLVAWRSRDLVDFMAFEVARRKLANTKTTQ